MKRIIKNKLTVGVTRDNNIVFMGLEVKEREGKHEFTASFDIVSPTILTEELVFNTVTNVVDSIDSDYKLELLENHDCRPSELVSNLIENSYSLTSDFFDNSLYPEELEIDDKTVFFDASSSGQHFEEVEEFLIEQSDCEFLVNFWKENHLQEIDTDVLFELTKVIDSYKDFDNDDVIENWVRKNFDKIK